MRQKKKVGLALGSGGPRGFAHIGVIKALEENDIPIDFIAGTSAGAIVGGAYAINKDLKQIEKFVSELPYWDMIKSFSDVNLKSGIVKGEKFLNLLIEFVDKKRIEDCCIPFAAVAAEKITGKVVTLKEGFLAEAMRASSSIPILFSPFKYKDGTELVDGGVSEQVPVDTVKDMGADIVIAVNLVENLGEYKENSRISAIQQYTLLVLKGLAAANCKNADVIISPTFKDTDWISSMVKRSLLIEIGEKATLPFIDNIKALLE